MVEKHMALVIIGTEKFNLMMRFPLYAGLIGMTWIVYGFCVFQHALNQCLLDIVETGLGGTHPQDWVCKGER